MAQNYGRSSLEELAMKDMDFTPANPRLRDLEQDLPGRGFRLLHIEQLDMAFTVFELQ